MYEAVNWLPVIVLVVVFSAFCFPNQAAKIVTLVKWLFGFILKSNTESDQMGFEPLTALLGGIFAQGATFILLARGKTGLELIGPVLFLLAFAVVTTGSIGWILNSNDKTDTTDHFFSTGTVMYGRWIQGCNVALVVIFISLAFLARLPFQVDGTEYQGMKGYTFKRGIEEQQNNGGVKHIKEGCTITFQHQLPVILSKNDIVERVIKVSMTEDNALDNWDLKNDIRVYYSKKDMRNHVTVGGTKKLKFKGQEIDQERAVLVKINPETSELWIKLTFEHKGLDLKSSQKELDSAIRKDQIIRVSSLAYPFSQ